jgi:Domain of unknown function (DUF4082)/Bacterial Ig-like domain
MTQIFQRGAKRYANVLGVLLALAVVSSILLHSGCGLTGSPNIPTPTPTPTPTPDMRPPTVTSFSPAAGAKNVVIDTNITVTFSEAMDAKTINFSTIDYRDPSGGNRGGSLNYNPATSTAILQPFDLPEGTTYTVRVRGGAAEPLVKDLAGNALVADVTWTFTTAIYPKVSVTTPSDGATGVSTGVAPIAYFNKPLDPKSVNDQSVALTDASNAPVPFNIFYDEGALAVRIVPAALLQPNQKYTVTFYGPIHEPHITGTDGLAIFPGSAFSFTTAPATPPIRTFSLFAPTDTPVNRTAADHRSAELGVKFRATVDGFVTGVRFYKGDATNGGTHVGHLWKSDGSQLGSVAFTDEKDSGWQQALFPTPIPITAGDVYVISYFAPQGDYAADNFYFAPGGPGGAGVNNGPLHALSNQEAGGEPNGNGVFLFNEEGGFPTTSLRASNYWVDVVFTSPAEPPQVLSVNPAPGATGVITGVAPTASFSESLNPTSLTGDNVQMFDTGNNPVPVTASYDPSNFTITITPIAPLRPSNAYVVSLGGITDSTGIPLATGYTWAFSTEAAIPPGPPLSLWADRDAPVNPVFNDPTAAEVGLKFSSDADGLITGIRFYKGGPENGGKHVGHLWTGDGKPLSTVTFTKETNSGWQQALFSKPIPITAKTTYVISYFAPQGYYAKDDFAFGASGVKNGPLRALSNSEAGADPFGNGVYLISPQGGFPVFSNLASNYWVDVIFVPVQL